jgi:hypothetical protein
MGARLDEIKEPAARQLSEFTLEQAAKYLQEKVPMDEQTARQEAIAFSTSPVHSDYVLTEDQLRRESGPASAIPLTEVDRKLNYTFRFLSGLLKAANNMKYALSHAKKYHKWDNYEVLELLADENGVYGFNVHFSNGSKSTFSRTKDGVTQSNLRTSNGVGFMIGIIDRLESVWKADSIPVTDWEEFSKRKALEPDWPTQLGRTDG